VRVVLDTNVLISGIFFSGPPAAILKAWRNGDVQFVLSPGIIDEYTRVAKIVAVGFPGIEINSILTLIITHSEIIQASPLSHPVCEDPDDDKFVACALAGKMSIIISGDKHLLKLSCRGITILTPRLFVDRYINKHL
jgi:putative PIN family toxin of toxin-antitoxin system